MADVLKSNEHQNKQDIKLFIGCMGAGLIGIIILKFVFNAPQWLVSAFPCSLVIFYFVYVCRSKRYKLRGDKAGDSVYYLGFLYTLLSLGLSLFQFVFTGMGAREIVGNLGIALSTTILGLMGRVVLTQLREDPVEAEESARMALAEATSAVRAELAQMVESVAIYRRTTVQDMVQGTELLSKETNKALTENVMAFTSSAKAVIDRIEEVFTDFGENAKKLNRASNGTITALEKLILRVEAIDAPQSLISAKFDPLAERIGAVFDNFSSHADAQRAAVDKLRNAFETSTERVGKSMETIGTISAAVKGLVDGIEGQAKAMRENANSVRELAEGIKVTLSQAADQQVTSSARLAAGFDDALKGVIGSTERTLSELTTSQRLAADSMTESLKVAVSSVTSALAAMEAQSAELTGVAKTQAEHAIQQLRERLDSVGNDAEQAIQEQTGRIEEIAKNLVAAAADVTRSAPTEPKPEAATV
jgi:DNA anti-recombination protein RmuC